MHPFERTLGPGPYSFVGVGKIHISETFGARYIGPTCDSGAGTCAHCGTGIVNIYVIKNANGQTFGVGSDCIGLLNLPMPEMTKIQKAKRAHNRALRLSRAEKKLDEVIEFFDQNAAYLDTVRTYQGGKLLPGTCAFYLRAQIEREKTCLKNKRLNENHVKRLRSRIEHALKEGVK